MQTDLRQFGNVVFDFVDLNTGFDFFSQVNLWCSLLQSWLWFLHLSLLWVLVITCCNDIGNLSIANRNIFGNVANLAKNNWHWFMILEPLLRPFLNTWNVLKTFRSLHHLRWFAPSAVFTSLHMLPVFYSLLFILLFMNIAVRTELSFREGKNFLMQAMLIDITAELPQEK